MHNLDEYLKNNVSPEIVPENALNELILERAKEKNTMKNKFYKTKIAAAIVLGVLAVGTGTVYAAYHLSEPSKVAEKASYNKDIEEAFVNEQETQKLVTKTKNGYEVSFMGMVSGTNLISKFGMDVEDFVVSIDGNKTYVVIGVCREDGNPISDINQNDSEEQQLFFTPLINGKTYDEANDYILNTSFSTYVEDGIQYYLVDFHNLEMFANMGVSLGIYDAYGDPRKAFNYDEKTEEYSVNDSYSGFNLIFELPLDKSKADDAAANEFLQYASEHKDYLINDADRLYRAFYYAYNSEHDKWKRLMREVDLVDEQTKEVDANGSVNVVSIHEVDGEKKSYNVSGWKDKVGVEAYLGVSSDGSLKGTVILTAIKNEDETFTIRWYKKN